MTEIIHLNSVTDVHNMMGFDKPKHPLISVFAHSPDLHRISSDIRVTGDLYIISMKEGVSGSFNYGRGSYDFQEGTMIFIAPGQVLTPGETEATGEEKGWNIIFHPDLIRSSELGRNIGEYSFFSYDANEALHLSEDEKVTLTELVSKIECEINQNTDKHTQKLISSNMGLLLDYCTRYYDRQFYTRSHVNRDLESRFKMLLKAYYQQDLHLLKGMPTVSYCGMELGVSPNYLSDLLKKETGRSARDHIHFYIIDQAKTGLLCSDQSISEIAYGLGFDYPSHFTKLFKKGTGVSPTEFRKLN